VSLRRCPACRTVQRAEPGQSCIGCDAVFADAAPLPPPAGPEAVAVAQQAAADHSTTRLLLVVFGVLAFVGVLGVRLAPDDNTSCTWTLFALPAVALFFFVPLGRVIVKLRVHVLLKVLVLLVLLVASTLGSLFLLIAVCTTKKGGPF
jgi:hypothetical protein